jgi:formate/nitrite transporter FocA (FNT family)
MGESKNGDEETDDILEPSHVVERVLELGEKRLQRPTLAHCITAFLGGLAVSFGVVAIAYTGGPWLESLGLERSSMLGSLAFPVGFVILIIGRSELFTENFLIPVVGVFEKRGKVIDLIVLWAMTLVFNVLAAALFAYLVTRANVLEEGARELIKELGSKRVDSSFGGAFVKAIFAGWVMTLLTWLVVAVRSESARVLVVWAVGALLAVAHFNHVIVSATEIFMAMGVGADISFGTWALRSFLPATIGNLVGGVLLVTLLTYAQARAEPS